MSWILTQTMLPPEGTLVETKIETARGVRRLDNMERVGRLWFPERSNMYVYYTPTHWRFITSNHGR